MDTTTIIIALLSSGGLFAVIGAVFNGFFTKRRLGAEATEIITKAASGVVERLNEEVARRVADLAEMKAEHELVIAALIEEHEAAITKLDHEQAEEREQWRRVLQLHVAWDYIAIEKLSHLGVELPPPPPILPAGPTHKAEVPARG